MKPTIALTFDDGPSEWTPRFLDLLARHGARATFFVLGVNVQGREDVLRRIVAEGHEIGLHGWDHARLDEIDGTGDLAWRIDAALLALVEAVDFRVTLWRSPWLSTPEWARPVIEAAGLRICDPDIDGHDASASEMTIRRTLVRGLRMHGDGAIVMLHDGCAPNGERPDASREPTLRALAAFLPRVRSVTVSELLGVAA